MLLRGQEHPLILAECNHSLSSSSSYHLSKPPDYSPIPTLACPLLFFSPPQKNMNDTLAECGTGRVNLLTDGIFYLQSI